MELVAGVDFLSYVRPRSPVQSLGESVETRTMPATLPMSETALHPGHGATPGAIARVACPADPARLRAAACQLVEGLCELHRAGTFHRDITPSNVLVTREGRVVISDFGLIAEMSAEGSGQLTSRAGTPAYMAPEQGAGCRQPKQPIGTPWASCCLKRSPGGFRSPAQPAS